MEIYIVKNGDTIYNISKKYNIDEKILISKNGIKNPFNLVVGQAIVIPQNNKKIGDIATNGYTYPNVNREILKSALPNLTFLTIFTYRFDEKGNLNDIDDEEIIKIALENNVAPIMLISTLDNNGKFNNYLSNKIFNDKIAQENLINNILEKLEQKKYFGLDIDFEYVYKEDEQNFIEFIKNITDRLNKKGYPVMTALAPKISKNQKGLLYEAHNYKKIGESSNAVLLMTYEWGYTAGPPMAVAPINKVKEVLDYAITEIPSKKIFMGIPNYGYDWKLPYIKGETLAKSLGNSEAIEIASKYNAEIKFDNLAKSPYFNYKDENGNEHIVWFEDARSIYAKLMLVYEYKFSGCGYWNLMREFEQNWLVLEELFNVYKI